MDFEDFKVNVKLEVDLDWELNMQSEENNASPLEEIPTDRHFQCTVCRKSFRQYSTLRQHLAIHSKARPFGCTVCQKQFNRVSTLISHRKTHVMSKQHECPICKKRFHQKGNLKNHMNVHTNIRPFNCKYCVKGFNQMSNLKYHERKYHREFVSNEWKCLFCDSAFTKRILLRRHELEDHQISVDPRSVHAAAFNQLDTSISSTSSVSSSLSEGELKDLIIVIQSEGFDPDVEKINKIFAQTEKPTE